MFSMTESRVLCEMQTPFYFVVTRHSGEDVNIYRKNCFVSITFQELQLNKPKQTQSNLT